MARPLRKTNVDELLNQHPGMMIQLDVALAKHGKTHSDATLVSGDDVADAVEDDVACVAVAEGVGMLYYKDVDGRFTWVSDKGNMVVSPEETGAAKPLPKGEQPQVEMRAPTEEDERPRKIPRGSTPPKHSK